MVVGGAGQGELIHAVDGAQIAGAHTGEGLHGGPGGVVGVEDEVHLRLEAPLVLQTQAGQARSPPGPRLTS